MSQLYETVTHVASAVQYRGHNFPEIARFVGPDRALLAHPLPQVMTSEQTWVTLLPGWWVALLDEKHITVLSERSFQDMFKPVDTSPQGV